MTNEAAMVYRKDKRYGGAHRCYMKAALAALRAGKDNKQNQLEREAGECEEYQKRTEHSEKAGDGISRALRDQGEMQAGSMIHAAEIEAEAKLKGQQMWIEAFRGTMLAASEKLFAGLKQLSATHAQMGQEISGALVSSFERLSTAHREAVVEHGRKMLAGLQTLSKATITGHIIEAMGCLKQGEMISEAQKQAASTIAEGAVEAGVQQRRGLETLGGQLLDGMRTTSQAIEAQGQLQAEATRYGADAQSQALESLSEELGMAFGLVGEAVGKHSRVVRQAQMGGLFADGILRGIGHGITGRVFRDGTVQATKQLAANAGRM